MNWFRYGVLRRYGREENHYINLDTIQSVRFDDILKRAELFPAGYGQEIIVDGTDYPRLKHVIKMNQVNEVVSSD